MPSVGARWYEQTDRLASVETGLMRTPVEFTVRAVLDTLVAHRNNLTRAGNHIAFGFFQHFACMGSTTIVVGASGEWITPALRLCSRGRGVMRKGRHRQHCDRADCEQGKKKSASRLNGIGRSGGGSRHGSVLSNEHQAFRLPVPGTCLPSGRIVSSQICRVRP